MPQSTEQVPQEPATRRLDAGEAACSRSPELGKLCTLEELGVGQAIHTAAAWHWTSRPHCQGLEVEKLHVLQEPDARKAISCAGAS